MTPTNDPPGDAPEEAVSQLNESLKTCHKVVTDYRAALLRPAPPAEPSVEEPQPDPEI